MKRYESYKDSGIEWIGEIPSHWEITKLKFIGNIICGGTPSTSNEEYWTGEIPWLQSGKVQNNIVIPDVVDKKITTNALAESSTKLVKQDSVLVAITGATCSNIGYLTFETAVNQSIVAVEPIDFNSVLLFNLLKSQKEQILYHQSGGAQGGVTKGDVMNIYIPLPPVQEQTAIANYLDRKTNQIDGLIAKKELLIQLLEEERTAIINQAVTKGLDPNVPMKDSGIEWLGEIPAHWEVTKVKHVVNIQGRVGYKGYTVNDLVSEGQGPLTLGAKHINKSNLLDLSNPEFISWDKYYESPEIMVFKGDLLLTQRGTLGKVVLIENEIGEATINPSMVLLNKLKPNSKFLYYFFSSNYFISWIKFTNTATAVPMISQEQLGNFKIVLPPLDVQFNIVKFLENKTNEVDLCISKTQQEIELLKEYKTALISEVVTGKVDVRKEL